MYVGAWNGRLRTRKKVDYSVVDDSELYMTDSDDSDYEPSTSDDTTDDDEGDWTDDDEGDWTDDEHEVLELRLDAFKLD